MQPEPAGITPPDEASPPPSPEDDGDADRLARAEELLGYAFDDRELLRRALTHASLRPSGAIANERLEFLGDAVLGVLVSEILFRNLPDRDEGELTRAKSVIVSTESLALVSRRIDLPAVIAVGKGVRGGGRLPDSLLAGAFEAIVGAIYLDGGLVPAGELVTRTLSERIEKASVDRVGSNYKALLQHLTQREWGSTPTYMVVAEHGPEHGKRFCVVAIVEDEELGQGEGRTKKEAEQAAARETLATLERRLEEEDEDADRQPPSDDEEGAAPRAEQGATGSI